MQKKDGGELDKPAKTKKETKPKKDKPKGYIFGRPSIYDPSLCEKLVEHMASGKSFDSFGGTIGVARETCYDWLKKHPDFSHAKQVGQTQRILWTENLYMETMNPSKKKKYYVNSYLLGFYTKNVLNWSENVKVSGDEEKPLRVLTLKYKPDPNAET